MEQKIEIYWHGEPLLIECMEKEYEDGWYVHQIVGPLPKNKLSRVSNFEWYVVYRKD